MEGWADYARLVDLTGLLSAFVVGVWCVVWFCQILAIVYGRRLLHKPIVRDASVTYPGVSVVKPLVNLSDPNLQKNLETFFHLDYSPYEILFCVQSEHQLELTALIQHLMAKYPDVDARLFIGEQKVGVNPKINNMINGFENAKYPYLLISDASVRVTHNTLLDMMNTALSQSPTGDTSEAGGKSSSQPPPPVVGLVHQLPMMLTGDAWQDGTPPPSRVLEKVYFGTAQARMYLAANALGVNCMTSMSCLVSRRALEDVGGLRAFGAYIGEDFFLGRALLARGYKMLLSSQPVQQDPGASSRSAWQARMTRWMHLRLSAMPHLLVLEPLSEALCIGPLAAASFWRLFDVAPHVFLPCHLLAWLAFDYLLFTTVENKRPPPFSVCCFLKAWIIRELSFFYIYACAVTLRTLSWGGRRFRLRWGGRASEVGSENDMPPPV